jgi:hypothetical protein
MRWQTINQRTEFGLLGAASSAGRRSRIGGAASNIMKSRPLGCARFYANLLGENDAAELNGGSRS